MIIKEDSPIRRLPHSLDPKQMLFLNAIQYSVEMADLAFHRLTANLQSITTENPSSRPHINFLAAVQDAWSIVDSLYRLRCLLRQMPGFKKNIPEIQVFLRKTKTIEHLRNAIQHLDRQIESLLEAKLPVLGVLGWCSFWAKDSKMVSSWAIVPGSLVRSGEHSLVNPLGRPCDVPLGLITLETSGYSNCLSESMRALEPLIGELESQLRDQFSGLPTAPADFLMRKDIALNSSVSRSKESPGDNQAR